MNDEILFVTRRHTKTDKLITSYNNKIVERDNMGYFYVMLMPCDKIKQIVLMDWEQIEILHKPLREIMTICGRIARINLLDICQSYSGNLPKHMRAEEFTKLDEAARKDFNRKIVYNLLIDLFETYKDYCADEVHISTYEIKMRRQMAYYMRIIAQVLHIYIDNVIKEQLYQYFENNIDKNGIKLINYVYTNKTTMTYFIQEFSEHITLERYLSLWDNLPIKYTTYSTVSEHAKLLYNNSLLLYDKFHELLGQIVAKLIDTFRKITATDDAKTAKKKLSNIDPRAFEIVQTFNTQNDEFIKAVSLTREFLSND